MRYYVQFSAWMFLSCFVPTSNANDSIATLGAGGIVFSHTEAIVMESEDLFISEEKIRVAYQFHNMTDKDITTRVAFPVPEFPQDPENDININLDTETKNPMNFSVVVEGEAQKFDTEVKKFDGLVKVTHHWQQVFPAGKTLSIQHEYVPASGGESVLYFEPPVRQTLIKDYCIEPPLVKWIEKNNHYETGKYISPVYVDYILTTGANWKDSIKKFRLTLQKLNPEDKISFCGTGVKKVNAWTFVMEKDNFIPAKDLKILFLHSRTVGE